MTSYAVIDFETTGLSPDLGDRPTEIGIVLVENGQISDRFQSLMNPGISIPRDIQVLTGITNAMVRQAPKVAEVMHAASAFVGNRPLLAHNAAFDKKFWREELHKIKQKPREDFACSVLLSRRLFPELANHKLNTLVNSLGLPAPQQFHRALADAECTAHLLIYMQQELQHRFALADIDHELLLSIQKKNRSLLKKCVEQYIQNNSSLCRL